MSLILRRGSRAMIPCELGPGSLACCATNKKPRSRQATGLISLFIKRGNWEFDNQIQTCGFSYWIWILLLLFLFFWRLNPCVYPLVGYEVQLHFAWAES